MNNFVSNFVELWSATWGAIGAGLGILLPIAITCITMLVVFAAIAVLVEGLGEKR